MTTSTPIQLRFESYTSLDAFYEITQHSGWYAANEGLSGTLRVMFSRVLVHFVRRSPRLLFHVASVGGRTVHPCCLLFSHSANESPAAAQSQSNESSVVWLGSRVGLFNLWGGQQSALSVPDGCMLAMVTFPSIICYKRSHKNRWRSDVSAATHAFSVMKVSGEFWKTIDDPLAS